MAFLQRYFEEKVLPCEVFEIELDGTLHLVESELVIDLILHAPRSEQEVIKGHIVNIDFRDGDIMKYLEFLASAYVKNQY